MEIWSTHQLFHEARKQGRSDIARTLQQEAKILRTKGLPVIFSLNHLAHIVGVSYLFLYNTVSRRREGANYQEFAIKKRNSKKPRYIHAPCMKLSTVQQFINECILQKIPSHVCSQAFSPGSSIWKCASQHVGANWVFKFDLKDFFSTISEGRVYKVFEGIGYKPLLAFELARICTTTRLLDKQGSFQKVGKSLSQSRTSFLEKELPYSLGEYMGVLPQGSPTSPMLSNLVAYNLDVDLNTFANENGFVYTRYSDDLTFSSAIKAETLSIERFITKVYSIIYNNHFIPNIQKTKVYRPGSRKIVLGLLVDGDRARLSKVMRKRVERNLYSIQKYGISEAAKHDKFESEFGYANHVKGLLAYTKDVDNLFWESCKKCFAKEIELLDKMCHI